MRLRFLFPALTAAAVIAVGVSWHRARAEARALQGRFAALTEREQTLAHVHADRERLAQELQEARRRVSEAPARMAAGESAVAAPAPVPSLIKGEWTPATAWRNEGRATPQAVANTLLWAAAQGDLAAFRGVFQFDEATLLAARAWYDSLPPEIQSLHATPADLVAGVTLASITPDRAQLCWLHENEAGRAIVGLLIAGPAAASAPPRPEPTAGKDNLPPALDDRARYKIVVLNLRRAADGWHVQVPATAIENLARNLRHGGGPASAR